MKNVLKIAFAATVLYSSYLVASGSDDKVLATYKGGDIKSYQVAEQFKNVFDATPNLKGKSLSDLDSNVQESLVRAYINIKLLEKEIKSQKIEDSKDFQEKLDGFRKQLAQNELLAKVIADKVTDKLVEEDYNRLVQENKDKEEVKARHILVKTQKEAEAIKQRIAKGEKFNELAKKLSEDAGSKASGGEIGYFVKGQTDLAFEEAAYALKKGEVSKPVKTQFGWHIIKLEDKRKIKLPAKEEGLNIVKARLEKAAIEKYLEDLNKQADVKILIEKAPIKESSDSKENQNSDEEKAEAASSK